MNFCLIVDACKVESYVVRDGKAYKFKEPDIPYSFHHSIKNESFMGFWGYPFVFGGCFINWSEWAELPDLDLDVIFVAIERNYNLSLDILRKKYPHAMIVSVLKETYNWNQQWQLRIPIYKQSDLVLIPVSKMEFFPNIELSENRIEFLPQPVDVNYLYDNFYDFERTEVIFPYIPYHNRHRIGKTKEFTDYINKKYDIPFIEPFNTQKSKTQWHDFINVWSKSTFHFNLDPTRHFPGQQAMQCAALGVIHIGGINDSHYLLWDETATNNPDHLEKEFAKCLSDYDYRVNTIQNAWNKLNQIYSYDAVKKQFEDMI